MKRFLLTTLVLIFGAGLGAGGLYVGLNWKKLNPYQEPERKDHVKDFTIQLRKACATESALKGATVKSIVFAQNKVILTGFVTRREQIALLEAKTNALLAETPDLQKECSDGLTTDGLKVVPIPEQLSTLLQHDLEDAAPGFETAQNLDALKRQVSRTTRLDTSRYTEDGKLTFSGVCIRGAARTEATNDALKSLLKARLEALGVSPALMPEIAVDVRHFVNPAATLQKQLAGNEQAKDIRLSSAWFDAKGQLHVAGIVADDAERQIVDDAVKAFAKDPQTAILVAAFANAPGSAGIAQHLVTFQADVRVRELQKKWVEHARKDNKPYLRRLRMDKIVPTALLDDKKQVLTDDDGNVLYFFQVQGHLLETAGERAQLEKDLTVWLAGQLPRVMNADQKPIPPRLTLQVADSPIFALQQRIVERRLDGAVFTDALFDEKGLLEFSGRLHQPDAAGKQALDAAAKEVLGAELPWTLRALQPHESPSDGQVIAWKDAVRQCQTRLAQDRRLGERVRVDRLYFTYEKQQLRLIGSGAFLADGPKESPDLALRKFIDDAISSRGFADIKTSAIKHVKNPLTELQNQAAERADLDGILFTNIRYGPDGLLHVDGFLGQAEHKVALAPLLAQQLGQIPDLLKNNDGAKAMAGWSIDGMKPHAAAAGAWKWHEVVHACQTDLAGAPEATYRRTCLLRVYFKYVEGKGSEADVWSRRLTLHCAATHLARAQPDDPAFKLRFEQKLGGVSKRLLTRVAIDKVHADVSALGTPIFELQDLAVAKRLDGILFQDAFYNRDGKLTIDGLRGNAEQLKQAKDLIDQLLARAERKALAPAGLAPLDGMKPVAWQPMLDEVRTQFARDKASLYKQTRIDRAYFQYDKAQTKALLHFQGICIYKGKVLTPEQRVGALTDHLKKQLQASDVASFTIDVGAVAPADNPIIEMQKQVVDRAWDGVVFRAIGFDAKGNCYVTVPSAPEAQEKNIRSLIDEFAKKNLHLKGIRQQ